VKKDLIQTLRDILKKNLTSDAGSAILDQLARSTDEKERKMVTVSVYNKMSDDSWLPMAKPLHKFEFAPNEHELALATMEAYSSEKYDVSVTFGNISEEALNGVQIAPYFEFISSQAPLDNVLSGTKSEFVGEA